MILFYLLVTVMPMIRHPLWSTILGDLTVIKYLGVACLLYAVVYLPLRTTPLHLFMTWQIRLFVLFSTLVIISFLALGSPEIPLELSPLASFVSFLVFMFVTLTLLDSVKRLRWVLLMAVGSVAYASLHLIREWQKYGEMAAGYRPGWVVGDPNYYSVSALLCIPIAIYLLRTKQPAWEKYFCIGSIVVTLVALTLAASRGGFVGMAAGAIVMSFHSKRRLRTFAIVTALTLPLMAVAPSSPLARLISPDQHDLYSAEHRTDLVLAGLRMFQSHPLTGIGPGNFKPLLGLFADLEEHNVAHNTYVEVLAEAGLPGFLLFIGIVTTTFMSLERVRRRYGVLPEHEVVARTAEAFEVGLAAFLASAIFLSVEAHRLFWLVVFVSAALPPLATLAPPRLAAPPSPRVRTRAIP